MSEESAKESRVLNFERERGYRERERLVEEKQREQRFILDALAQHGVYVDAIEQLVPDYAPLSTDIVEVLLDALPKAKNPILVEWIVRMLAATKVTYDATPLLNAFDATSDADLKWVIANTLECSGPKSIAPWLQQALRDPAHGKGRQMLCMAAGKLMPQDAARQVLREVFDQYPGHAATGLGRCGTPEDLEFLRSWLPRAEMTWIRNEIKKAIAKIEKREQKKRR